MLLLWRVPPHPQGGRRDNEALLQQRCASNQPPRPTDQLTKWAHQYHQQRLIDHPTPHQPTRNRIHAIQTETTRPRQHQGERALPRPGLAGRQGRRRFGLLGRQRAVDDGSGRQHRGVPAAAGQLSCALQRKGWLGLAVLVAVVVVGGSDPPASIPLFVLGSLLHADTHMHTDFRRHRTARTHVPTRKQVGLNSWGQRAEASGLKAFDVSRGAAFLGTSFLTGALFQVNTQNSARGWSGWPFPGWGDGTWRSQPWWDAPAIKGFEWWVRVLCVNLLFAWRRVERGVGRQRFM